MSQTISKFLTPSIIRQLVVAYGHDFKKSIEDNPYILAQVGLDLETLDGIAKEFGSRQAADRVVALAILYLKKKALSGHVYEFGETLVKDLRVDSGLLTAALRRPEFTCVGNRVYLRDLYKFETQAAEAVCRMNSEEILELSYSEAEYTREQELALELFKTRRMFLLSGLPGTGKTTLIKTFVDSCRRAGLSYSTLAPTGISAKRLGSVTGTQAMTIHRALQYDGDSWHRQRIHSRVVIVDEMSMVDTELFYRLVSCLDENNRLVLVGDANQLPSVGPGNVFRELLSCEEIPQVRLTQIHRQAEQSGIVAAAHRINRGEEPETKPDFSFLEIVDENTIAETIVAIASKMKEKNKQFQVMSPKYAGAVGVDRLNSLLQQAMNPDGGIAWKSGDCSYRIGDRVMVTKNNYKLGIYNGDMAKISAVNSREVTLKIHGYKASPDLMVAIPRSITDSHLRLGYCISVHKSQGMEYDHVVMPEVSSHGPLQQRGLLYTAVTRARQNVYLVGQRSALSKAIRNNQAVFRNSYLAGYIKEKSNESGN